MVMCVGTYNNVRGISHQTLLLSVVKYDKI